MNSEKMSHILEELSKPFHPSRITWRPGALTGKKDKAMALAYADLRAYQNRLDELCGMDWSVSYTPWSDRIICHLTVNGVTRSSTGEPDSDSERSEIAGTAAEAQAFKRACAMFGLGRYLYNLPSIWVEYDAENRRFHEKAKTRLQSVIAQHYQRFLDGQDQPNDEETQPDTGPTAQVEPAVEATQSQPEQPVAAQAEVAKPEVKEATPEVAVAKAPAKRSVKTNGTNGMNGANSMNSLHQDEVLVPLHKTLDELGQELYGEQWLHVRAHNIKRLVGEQNDGNGALSKEQIQTLINGLKKLKQQRLAA